MRNSFILRVLTIGFLFLALPILIISFLFSAHYYDLTIAREKAHLKEAATVRAYAIDDLSPISQVFLKQLAFFLKVEDQEVNPTRLTERFLDISKRHKDSEFILLEPGHDFAANYRILASSWPDAAGTYFKSYRDVKKIEKSGEGEFIRYLKGPFSSVESPYLFIGHTFYDPSTEKPIVILLVAQNISKQMDRLLAHMDQEPIEYALLTQDGVVFAASESGLQGEYFFPINEGRRAEIFSMSQLGKARLASTPLTHTSKTDFDEVEFSFKGSEQIGYIAQAEDLYLLAYTPKKIYFHKALTHFLVIYVLAIIIILVAALVAFWISAWIARPLRQLTHLMGEVSEGTYDHHFVSQPLGFEINKLGEAFNETVDALLRKMQIIEDERVKKETYQKEVEIGRKVQKGLVPRAFPEMEGVEIAGAFLSAEDVGGDFYFVETKMNQAGDEVLLLTVADTPGRGITSSLYALISRSLLRTYASLYDDVGEILSRANNDFIRDTGESGMFVTALMATYNPKTRELSYFSSGHVPGLVRTREGEIHELSHSGMALGLLPSEGYKADTLVLGAGDIVVFYTKGLIETANNKNQFFSLKGLKESLQRRRWNSAREVVVGLKDDIQNFAGRVERDEEVIIVTLKENSS